MIVKLHEGPSPALVTRVVSRAHKEVCLGELAALEAHITTREEEKHGLEAELARLRGAGQGAGGVTQPGHHGDGDTPPTPHPGQLGAGHTQPLQQELLRQEEQRRQQEEQRRQQEEKQRQEDQRRQQEEQHKLEEQRRLQEEQQRQEEQRKLQEEQQRQEEQRRQQEEHQKQEEQRRQQEEQQRQQDQGVQS